MRKLEYLSPTSISKYYENKDEFYLIYLADVRAPRIPQTRPMSVGSAFDAYTKSYLHEQLFGKGNDPKFEFDTIFTSQVEPQNRVWAKEAGKHAFECYRKSGALADLMFDLQAAVGTPKFELEIKGTISHSLDTVSSTVNNVPFLGKPDVHFFNKEATHIVLDWKVNGYCSNASPMAGYIRLRADGRDAGCHRDAMVMNHKGIMINVAAYLERYDKKWADQLAIYGWLCGREVGDEMIVAIDQLACKRDDPPKITIAEHRLRISPSYQREVFARSLHVWTVSTNGHFFHELTKTESDAKCQLLEDTAASLLGDGSSNDKWFNLSCRE